MESDVSQANIYIFAGIASLFVVGFIVFVWKHLKKTRHQRHVEKVLESLKLKYIKDIVLPDGVDGLVFIDYLLLVPNGIVVLDIHYSEGHLFGGETVDQWSQVVNNKTYKFNNPLYDNQNECQAVIWNIDQQKDLQEENNKTWETFGRIAFSNAGNFPKGIPEHVSMIDRLHSDLGALTEITQPVGDSMRSIWDRIHDISRATQTK